MPKGHNTNHRALIVELVTNGREVCQYRHKVEKFPLDLPSMGPRREAETLFGALRNKIPMRPVREKYTNSWIRE